MQEEWKSRQQLSSGAVLSTSAAQSPAQLANLLGLTQRPCPKSTVPPRRRANALGARPSTADLATKPEQTCNKDLPQWLGTHASVLAHFSLGVLGFPSQAIAQWQRPDAYTYASYRAVELTERQSTLGRSPVARGQGRCVKRCATRQGTAHRQRAKLSGPVHFCTYDLDAHFTWQAGANSP